jgi:Leucine Rich Repeat (LRR) protein
MPRRITPRTTVEHLKTDAKRWLRALRANDGEARERIRRAFPDAPESPTLRDVQHALALEHGYPGWTSLVQRLAPDAPMRRYEQVADAIVVAYATPDPAAVRIVWDYFGHMRAWDAMRRYIRLDLGKTESPAPNEIDEVTLDEARYLVARAQGFESWDALEAYAGLLPPGKKIAEKAVALFASGGFAHQPAAVRVRDWDEVVTTLRQRRLVGLGASGQMTDALLEQIVQVEHLTTLDLGGSRGLTDDGLRHLARLPELRHVNLGGCPITDRGLAVLRELPKLESIGLAWTHTTDAGAAHLAACDAIRLVDLTGTATGDGAIRALDGKAALRELRTGNGMTDAGLPLLHGIPAFVQWHEEAEQMALLSPRARPNMLSLRGAFTDRGFAQLVGLDGLFALDVDSDQLAITGAALAPLVELAHLTWLGFDAKDESMAHIARLPHLRFLMCQDTSAGDEGFVALGRSKTIEHIWGRRCHNLQRRGFVALSEMPALRYLSVSCKNVDDVGLSALPRFPALRELMPMDVPDEGYRHIGRCERIESLVLMYCRDTGDRATEHITGLRTLRKYFASYNRITDRTPELLSGMDSLEEITFDSCAGLSNAGIAHLARLPRLRELRAESMPKVTAEVGKAFGPGVKVSFWT